MLLKAVRGLPESEQDTVLAYLVERALSGARGESSEAKSSRPPEPAAEVFPERSNRPKDEPSRRPTDTTSQSSFPTLFVPPDVTRGLGSVAAGLLLRNNGVAEVAALCAISEGEVVSALRDLSTDSEAPDRLTSYLRLLAEGRSGTESRRKLKLTRREIDALREDAATRKLELRLGQQLLLKTQGRETLRTLLTHSFAPRAGTAPSAGTVPPSPSLGLAVSVLPPHDTIRHLLIAGEDVEQIAQTCEIRVDAVREALHTLADHPDATDTLAAILRLIANGRSRAEVTRDLGISQKEFSAALDPLRSSALQQKLLQAFSALAVARPIGGGSGAGPRAEMVGAGALGSGAQQMVPVRFPEVQHQRLKAWCTTHGFSMAVVVRGLVERFLDEQERRAA